MKCAAKGCKYEIDERFSTTQELNEIRAKRAAHENTHEMDEYPQCHGEKPGVKTLWELEPQVIEEEENIDSECREAWKRIDRARMYIRQIDECLAQSKELVKEYRGHR